MYILSTVVRKQTQIEFREQLPLTRLPRPFNGITTLHPSLLSLPSSHGYL